MSRRLNSRTRRDVAKRRRFDNDFVKNELEKYGYFVPNDFNYTGCRNNFQVYDKTNEKEITLNWNKFKYRVRRGREEYEEPNNLMNIGLSED